ncbi:CocE/NonD family hydrolase, partial [Klebsiella pneumoniae]|nr:CocE/NonD family hydrolase [Klebsiella pneumoniae]
MSTSRRRRKGLLVVALACIALVVLVVSLRSIDDQPFHEPPASREAMVDVLDGPDRSERIQIDVTLYSPEETPAPVVMIAHGFGGTKQDSEQQARELAKRGFTVLTYSARGFGRSTGKIALNSQEYEVTDAQQLLDWLARQPEVLRDGDGDPRVGVTGVSYGGALSLLLAGTDPRVDAIAPIMTYNDL